MHGDNIELVGDEKDFKMDEWYMAMSNHQSWADIFVLLVSANYKIPLLKFFMKKELWWIPFIFLANKTLNMPFVNRHSKEQIKKDPSLRTKDYKNTLKSCKRFLQHRKNPDFHKKSEKCDTSRDYENIFFDCCCCCC